jgi:hypothetical protein
VDPDKRRTPLARLWHRSEARDTCLRAHRHPPDNRCRGGVDRKCPAGRSKPPSSSRITRRARRPRAQSRTTGRAPRREIEGHDQQAVVPPQARTGSPAGVARRPNPCRARISPGAVPGCSDQRADPTDRTPRAERPAAGNVATAAQSGQEHTQATSSTRREHSTPRNATRRAAGYAHPPAGFTARQRGAPDPVHRQRRAQRAPERMGYTEE